MTMIAIIVNPLEIIVIKRFPVSVMNATEIATIKTPKYKLALLLANSSKSERMVRRYLLRRIKMVMKARNMNMKVNVMLVQ